MEGWYLQYLEAESTYYLTQLHPESGIIFEGFYESWDGVFKAIKENGITVQDVKILSNKKNVKDVPKTI